RYAARPSAAPLPSADIATETTAPLTLSRTGLWSSRRRPGSTIQLFVRLKSGSWLSPGRRCLTRWDQAEALGFDAERRVELAAEVFERDCRGQLHDLGLAVILFQPGKQHVIDTLAGDRHALGVFERDPLRIA